MGFSYLGIVDELIRIGQAIGILKLNQNADQGLIVESKGVEGLDNDK